MKWQFKQQPQPQATPQMPNQQFGQAGQSVTTASSNPQHENYNGAEFDHDGGYLNDLDNYDAYSMAADSEFQP